MNVCSMLWGKLCHLFDGLREMLRILTESLIFDAFIFLVVCLNIIMLVVQTFAEVEVRGGKSRGAPFMLRRLLMLLQGSCRPDPVPSDLYNLAYLTLSPGKWTTWPSVRDEAQSKRLGWPGRRRQAR